MKSSLRAALFSSVLLLALHSYSAPPKPGSNPLPLEAPQIEDAWSQLVTQNPQPAPPAEWKKNTPSEEEVAKWIGPEAKRLEQVAAAARGFAEKYPRSAKAPAALDFAADALYAAIQLGSKSAEKAMTALDDQRLKDPTLPEEMRLEIRSRQIKVAADAKLKTGELDAERIPGTGAVVEQARAQRTEAAEAEARQVYLEGARQLMKEFPKSEAPYAMLVEAAGEGTTPDSAALLKEVSTGEKTPARVRARAAGILRRGETLGKELELKFTAIDGREVDLKNYRGKVILLDFWATWCGPCVAALPTLKKTYEEMQKGGLEVIGISFDQDRSKVQDFVKEKEIPWPQYFDGKYWENEIGHKYGIASIPTMWLIDKKGILRDAHADVNLSGKVKALLEEEKAP
jgi:peroxiredoxin